MTLCLLLQHALLPCTPLTMTGAQPPPPPNNSVQKKGASPPNLQQDQ